MSQEMKIMRIWTETILGLCFQGGLCKLSQSHLHRANDQNGNFELQHIVRGK